MSDAIRSPEPDDDPFLEFPSEREMVSGLTRRLRPQESDQDAADDSPESIPDSLWQDEAGPFISLPAEPVAADHEPIVRPVSRSELLLTPQPRAFPGPDEPDPPQPVMPASPPIDDQTREHVDNLTDQIRARANVGNGRRPNLREILTTSGAVAVMLALMFGYVQLTSSEPVALETAAAGDPTSNATITSRPEGATVLIDGVARGQTPLTLALPVGEYGLELQRDDDTASMPLTIEPNRSVSAHVELADQAEAESATAAPVSRASPPAPRFGWVEVDMPIDLVVRDGDTLLEPTDAGRIQLSPGRHQLELASETLEFMALVDVVVTAGRTTTARATLPNGTVSISAWPWAHVTVNGMAIGATPLGNLQLPIGDHEVVWTHPQFGERRQTVTVRARTPTKVGIDFTQ